MKKSKHILSMLHILFLTAFNPKYHFSKKKIPINDWFSPTIPPAFSMEPIIMWIGHSTFLIQIGGINILTDPVFFNLSPLIPRLVPPGIKTKNF